MDKRYCTDLPILECAEPACLRRGILGDPRANGLDYEDVGQTRNDCFSSGPEILGFSGHEPQRGLHPFHLGGGRGFDTDRLREQLDELVRRRVVKTNNAAHHPRGRAAAAVLDDLVVFADLLARQIEEVGRIITWFAQQPVTLTVGNQREIARLEQAQFGPFNLEPTMS